MVFYIEWVFCIFTTCKCRIQNYMKIKVENKHQHLKLMYKMFLGRVIVTTVVRGETTVWKQNFASVAMMKILRMYRWLWSCEFDLWSTYQHQPSPKISLLLLIHQISGLKNPLILFRIRSKVGLTQYNIKIRFQLISKYFSRFHIYFSRFHMTPLNILNFNLIHKYFTLIIN